MGLSSSERKRRKKVRARDPYCTAVHDGVVCNRPTDHAHHLYRRELPVPDHLLRNKIENMCGVCRECHDLAHRWDTRDSFPPTLPLSDPHDLTKPGWHPEYFERASSGQSS